MTSPETGVSPAASAVATERGARELVEKWRSELPAHVRTAMTGIFWEVALDALAQDIRAAATPVPREGGRPQLATAPGSERREGVGTTDVLAAGETPAGRTTCAWCSPGQGAPGESHGICDHHLIRELTIPRLRCVAARLGGASYLGTDARRELFADLDRVTSGLERLCARVLDSPSNGVAAPVADDTQRSDANDGGCGACADGFAREDCHTCEIGDDPAPRPEIKVSTPGSERREGVGITDVLAEGETPASGDA